MLVMFRADERANRGGTDGAVHVRQAFDVRFVETAHLRGAARRPARDVHGEIVEAQRVCRDPLVVDKSVANQDVHHRQHQRHIGAGQWLQEPIRRLRSHRAQRVDHDDLRALRSSRLDDRPQVAVGETRVGAPEDD